MILQPSGPWDYSFGRAAFGGYSTGYSNSLFLFVVFLVFWHRLNNKSFLSLETAIIIVIIFSQYLSGGRAGLLSSLLVFLIGYKLRMVFKILGIISILYFVQSDDLLTKMRILNPNSGENFEVDKISSGRIGLGEYYFEKFKKEPTFGYGFGNNEVDNFGDNIENIEVHIVWLRNLVQGGAIYVFFLLFLFVAIFYQFYHNGFLENEERRYFYNLFFIFYNYIFLNQFI